VTPCLSHIFCPKVYTCLYVSHILCPKVFFSSSSWFSSFPFRSHCPSVNGVKGGFNLPLLYRLTSVSPLHNAQVCYFNNVWLMFLVFLKKKSFQTTVGPPPLTPVLCISHPGSLTRRAPPADPSHFSLRFFNPSSPPGRSFAFPTPIL
jgi:hypothetical protein